MSFLSWMRLMKSELKALKTSFYYRPKSKEAIIEHFHRLYYESCDLGGTWVDTRWLGVKLAKCPLDLWIYQEIISALKPDLIVECGTGGGGSALYLASICDLIQHGDVVTIDIEGERKRPSHPRIQQFIGSSISEPIIQRVADLVKGKKVVMVLLDSAHDKEHVLQELRRYSPFVTLNSFLIVEDTNINGHPVGPNAGPGPMEAVEVFLQDNHEFVVDLAKEKFFMTFNPKGYLKRVAPVQG